MTHRDKTGTRMHPEDLESLAMLETTDPDIVLITDYLAEELSRGDTAAVERRLVEDEAFFEKAWPYIEAWDLTARPRAEADEASRQPKRPTRDIGSRLRGPTRWNRWTMWSVPLVAAAVIGGIIVVQRMTRPAQPVQPLANAPSNPLRDSVIAALQASGTLAQLPGPSVIATGAGESREVVLADGSRVVLQPNSWVAYSDSILANPATVSAATGVMMGGDAEIDVQQDAARPSRVLTVLTSAGSASLKAGRYALRALPTNKDFLVRVLRGAATVRGLTGSPGSALTARPGESVRVPMGDAPRRTVDSVSIRPPTM